MANQKKPETPLTKEQAQRWAIWLAAIWFIGKLGERLGLW